ncbi:MAG: hypothetical protein QOJ29_557 [Thermoleophilaceae bacterium]|nr:hypothetical protein [Thermoleophilaceae bacterium]
MSALVRALALGRVAVGVAMIARPELAVRGWIGTRAASYGGTQTLTQACGIRDLSLGAGTLRALMSGGDARDWVLLAAAADAVDFYATATAEDIPASGRVLVMGLAAGAVAVSVAYAASTERGSTVV